MIFKLFAYPATCFPIMDILQNAGIQKKQKNAELKSQMKWQTMQLVQCCLLLFSLYPNVTVLKDCSPYRIILHFISVVVILNLLPPLDRQRKGVRLHERISHIFFTLRFGRYSRLLYLQMVGRRGQLVASLGLKPPSQNGIENPSSCSYWGFRFAP